MRCSRVLFSDIIFYRSLLARRREKVYECQSHNKEHTCALITQDGGRGAAYAPNEARHYLRQMTLSAIRLLRSGEVLLIFPEGYPNIDPHPTPKTDLEAFLPFQPGFVKLAEQAERDGQTQVAIIPIGLTYTRLRGNHWRVTVRFGPALFRRQPGNTEQLLHSTEEYVHTLSTLALSP